MIDDKKRESSFDVLDAYHARYYCSWNTILIMIISNLHATLLPSLGYSYSYKINMATLTLKMATRTTTSKRRRRWRCSSVRKMPLSLLLLSVQVFLFINIIIIVSAQRQQQHQPYYYSIFSAAKKNINKEQEQPLQPSDVVDSKAIGFDPNDDQEEEEDEVDVDGESLSGGQNSNGGDGSGWEDGADTTTANDDCLSIGRLLLKKNSWATIILTATCCAL